MKYAEQALTTENIKSNLLTWWKNTRTKSEGGLRLSEKGIDFITNILNLQVYEITFPPTLDLKPKVILYLDKFIDCPYYLTEDSITVLNERKAFELHLFSGDVQKYGLAKAMNRKKTTN